MRQLPRIQTRQYSSQYFVRSRFSLAQRTKLNQSWTGMYWSLMMSLLQSFGTPCVVLHPLITLCPLFVWVNFGYATPFGQQSSGGQCTSEDSAKQAGVLYL